jgi:peptidoglycan hydrolase-like protein with peptidoglycan-binding domain
MSNLDRATTTFRGPFRRGAAGPEVRHLQELLNLAGSRPRLPTTGLYGEMTEQSVRYFQSTNGLPVDGILGSNTFAALSRSARLKATLPVSQAVSTGRLPAVAGTGAFCFPLAHVPSPTWKTGARYFGAPRDDGRRLHAGCDLLGPKGTIIHAIADGTLVRPAYYFYTGTYAVELRHGPFIVRYGEILGGSYIGGHSVKKGQPIAQIGRLDSGSSMLHFEMYSNADSTESLTTATGPYKRRGDLINPSSHLDEWAKHLPGR